MLAWHDFHASTLNELSVSSGGVTQPCSCVNSGGCLYSTNSRSMFVQLPFLASIRSGSFPDSGL